MGRRGITVKGVIAGIAIKDGAKRLADNGIEVDAILEFAQVHDEVCERDFWAGSKDSGRVVVEHNAVYRAPYLAPFGDVQRWASIPPDAVTDFSRSRLQASRELWIQMGGAIGQPLRIRDLPSRMAPLGDPNELVTEYFDKAEKLLN